MASVVEIQVQVNPTDSAAKIGAVKTELQGIGDAGAVAGQRAGAGMQQMGGHVATGLDSVRLLSQEFGLRMPRAIEAMLSRMPAVTSALSGALGLMTGIAAVEIFSRAIEGGAKLYTQYLSLNAAADKFYETLQKTAEQDITNTRSLETTVRRGDRTTGDSTALQGLARSQHSTAMSDLMQGQFMAAGIDFVTAHNSMDAGIKNQEQSIQLTRIQIDQEHQLAVDKINEQHASDAMLAGAQKNNAEASKAIALAAEKRKYDTRVERFYGNAVPQNAGAEDEQIADDTALKAAAAQNAKLGQDSALAIMKANDQAVQAGLQGEALYHEKMLADIRETTAELEVQGKAAEIPARVREINEKYFNDLSERAVKAQNESGLSIRRSQSAGLTGAARIYADQDEQINKNNTSISDPEQQHAANVAAATEANNKLTDLQQQFAQRMESIEAGRVDATLGGYARIAAEAAKTSQQIEQDFNKSWGGANVDQGSAEYLAAKKAEQDALTAVQLAANDKRTALTQADQAENLRYDQQAAEAERRVKEQGAMGWVAANKNAIVEIEAQEKERLAKLDQEYAKGLVSWGDYQQRTVDVEREAAAQIEQQQQAMSQKLSGLFESAFKDPIGTIKSTMEKLMFDLLAQWILHFKMVQNLMGSSLNGGQLSGGARQTGGSMLGGIVGHALGGGASPAAVAASVAGGSGSASQVAAQMTGGSGPGAGYRPAYAGGLGASGPISSAGIIGGAASPAAIGGDISSARSVASMVGLGGGSGSPGIGGLSSIGGASSDTSGSGISFDDQGNATLNSAVPDQSMPSLNMGGVNAAGAASSGALATGLGYAGAAGAAYSAEQTTVSAFDKGSASGVLSGTLGDAAAGATIGSVIPGIGTAIGAGIGAAVGFASGLAGAVLGMGGRIAARDYYEKTLFPQIEADRNGQGGDAMAAISDVNRIAVDGYNYMSTHFGASGATWVKQNYLDKEVQLALQQITQHAEGGQQYTERQAMQFHTGGYISDFGDFGTGGGQGLISALMGETVMNQSATATHAPVLNAMNDGASPADIASTYLASAKGGSSSAPAASDSGDHYHFHTLDTGTMETWLRQRGARMIYKAQNNLASQYAGDGVIG